MADNRKKLSEMIDAKPTQPVLKKGKGYGLSTEAEVAPEPTQPSAESHSIRNSRNLEMMNSGNQEPGKVKRIKPGYLLREDLIQACRRIAFDENRHYYEVIEEALEQYIERRKGGRK